MNLRKKNARFALGLASKRGGAIGAWKFRNSYLKRSYKKRAGKSSGY